MVSMYYYWGKRGKKKKLIKNLKKKKPDFRFSGRMYYGGKGKINKIRFHIWPFKCLGLKP